MLPIWFIGHGSPMEALSETSWQTDLRTQFAVVTKQALREGTPVRAFLFVSAHWNTHNNASLTASDRPATLHDFEGFPDALYRLRHDAPGDPALAAHIANALWSAGFDAALDSARPRDHGTWIPARVLDPKARLPVLQMAVPASFSPAELIGLGKTLAPLRTQGVLVVASGNVTHNLGHLAQDAGAPEVPWAVEFESWVENVLAKGDLETLCDWRKIAPHAVLAHPTPDHFRPLLVAAGAGLPSPVQRFHHGMVHGTLSMDCFSFGTPPGA